MYKNLLKFAIVLLLLPLFAGAQEVEKGKFGVKLSGFIRNDMVYNTRQVTSARGENQFVLMPKGISKNADDNDINETPNFNLVGLNTRMKIAITGPDAFGAKTSGVIETDFFGTAATKFNLRMRHAFMKLNWEKAELVAGQAWHPTFVPQCFPGTVSFGGGAPFNALARVPQIKLTYKLGSINLIGVMMSQGHFKGKAPAGSHINSGIPELHAQLQFKNESLIAGAGFGYQVLRPQLVFEETVNSTTMFGFLKYKAAPITIKLYGMMGQNNDNTLMMGGYAVSDIDEVTGLIKEYTPFNTMNAWVDLHTNGKTVQYGLFFGYSENLGATDDIVGITDENGEAKSSFVGRWSTSIQSFMKVSPRVIWTSGKFKVGVELEYFSVNYLDYKDENSVDAKGVIEDTEAVNNIKFLLMLKYAF